MEKCSVRSFVLFLTILSMACHKDEVDQKGTITFTVDDVYNNYWVTLSDQTGKVLDWKALTNGAAQSFTYTQNKDSVNLTIVSKSTAMSFYMLKTFMKVAPGDYSITPSGISTNTPAGNYMIGASGHQYDFDPQSENPCGDVQFSYPDMGEQCTIPLCGVTNLYSFINDYSQTDPTPRYLYMPSISPGGSLLIDNNLFSQLPEMKSKTINFGQATDGFSIAVGNTIQKKRAFLASVYDPGNSFQSLPIYYPDLTGKLFSDYVFSVYYNQQPNIFNYVSKQSQVPADSYPELNVGFNLADSTKITSTKILINSTGSAHYTFTALNYNIHSATTNLSAWWYVYSNYSNQIQITLPQFPDDLKSVVDLSYVSKLKSTQVSFIQDNGLGGYTSFYQKQLGKMGLVTPAKPVDQKQRIYSFDGEEIIAGRSKAGNPDRFKSIIVNHY